MRSHVKLNKQAAGSIRRIVFGRFLLIATFVLMVTWMLTLTFTLASLPAFGQSALRVVHTGENLPANTKISKNGCPYSFDFGNGCYKGHYHHGDLGASAPVVVSSPTFAAEKAFRYFIPGNSTGGSSNSYRSSIVFQEEWAEMTNWHGTEHWIGWAIRLDDDYPYPAPGYAVTMQFHSISWLPGNEQKSPVWAIRTAENGQWQLTWDNPLTNPDVNLGSYQNDRGQWVEWVVHIRYDCAPDGFIEIWKNGQLVYSLDGVETYNCEDVNFGYYIPGLYNSYMQTHSAPDFGAVISDLRIADENGNFSLVSPSSYLSGGGGGSLPSPWDSDDIGAVGAAGGASESGGTFTVEGSGEDIWGTADEFHFVYRQWTGDVEVIARVTSSDVGGNAGVMIRESLSPGSKHAFALVKEGAGTRFKRRTSTNGSTVNTVGTAADAPIWLKVVRSGNTFEGYESTDGQNWTLIDSATISMSSTVYVGLAVSSLSDGTLNETTFTNVTVQAPNAWSHQDIGAVGAAGDASESGGTWTVEGSGEDIWGTADEFHFVYRQWTGDVEVIARVTSSDVGGNAGVMIRESLSAGSKHAFALVKEGDGTRFKRRTSTNGSTVNTVGSTADAPIWLKVVRSGNTFEGYESTDGQNWALIDSETISMNSTVYVGLAVSSLNDGTLNETTFDNVTVK